MWNLEYELIAILLLAAIIGLIMGRFLCKSGESEEKIKKEKVTYAFKSLQSDAKKQVITIEEQQEVINEQERIISDLEQTNSNLLTRLASSDEQSQTLLKELKVLEKYKMRFEALTKEFDVQVNAMERLKAQKSSALEEIEQFNVQTNTLKQNIANREKESRDIVAYKEQQEQRLDELLTVNKNQDKVINELTLLRDENAVSIEEGMQREKQLNQLLKENGLELERLKAIEEEYTSYKESFNEANLLELEESRDRLYTEREDLLSRLRAISSVVDAVGVEEEE